MENRSELLLVEALENHYVKNLKALKEMFGPNAKMGVLNEGYMRCGTLAELAKFGIVPAEYAELDDLLIESLQPLVYK